MFQSISLNIIYAYKINKPLALLLVLEINKVHVLCMTNMKAKARNRDIS